MADRYQDRPFPADDGYDHGDDRHSPARTESDPLAELARLIGQTDPFANSGRGNQPMAPRSAPSDPVPPAADDDYDDERPAGPPSWMQRAARPPAPAPSYPDHLEQQDPDQDFSDHDVPDQGYPSAEHPLRRYAVQPAETELEYHAAPPHADDDQPLDPSRYDDALYGQLEAEAQGPAGSGLPG